MPYLNFDSSHVFYYTVRAAGNAQPLHHTFGWERVTCTKNFIVVARNREDAAQAALRSFGNLTVLSIAQVKSALSSSDIIIDQHFVPEVPAPAPKET